MTDRQGAVADGASHNGRPHNGATPNGAREAAPTPMPSRSAAAAGPSAARGGGDGNRPGGLAALRRALAYLRGHVRDAAGAFIALLVVTAANLATPQLVQLSIDGGIKHKSASVILYAVIGLVVIAVVRGIFTFLQGYLAERASQGVAYDLRDALFTRLERLSFSYYDRVQTGQLLTRLTNDVEQVRTFAGTGVIQLSSSVVMLVGSIVLLLRISWSLTLVTMLIIPAIFVLLMRFVRRIGPLFGQVQQTLGRLNTILQEDLQGNRVIRAFVREDYETARYRDINNSLLNKNIEATRLLSNNFPFVFLLANIGTLIIIWFGGLQVIGRQIDIGQLIAFNTYLSFLLMPILTIGFLAAQISRAGASSLRIFDILDAPLEVTDKPGAVDLPPIAGRVEFRDVCFRYPSTERDILHDISFSAEPGQTVAILGTTGSGKSTLVNLIPRFYDVTGGAVLVDGHDVRDVTLASLRSQIGIVLQEALLFSGPVRDNIAYGRPDATQDDVEAAARAAQADEFIRALPQGYDTVVGERGVGLSGGQRQRIAIARALLVSPKLLILDDSTSAVDAETELLIQQALDTLMRDRSHTAFVIAQRISTVRDADLILVLDGGRIAARGTHDELTRESPLYNEILGSQLQPDEVVSRESTVGSYS
jgi:ATP-binding cassette subfamily B multidrug efflux pump